jgi:WD40 repeat protein
MALVAPAFLPVRAAKHRQECRCHRYRFWCAMLTWGAHTDAVTSLAFVPGGGLLSTGTDGVLKHWDPTTGSLHYFWKLAEGVSRYTATECALLKVVADATGRYAAVGLRTEGVRFFDLSDGSVANEFRLAQLVELAPSPDGESVFCGGQGVNGGGRIWELRSPTGAILAQSVSFDRIGHRGGLAVSPDGKQVIAGRTRFDWPSGEVAAPVVLATGNMLAVSPDGDKLFGANGSRLMVWGFQVGALRRKLKGHLAPVIGLTTTPDGRKLWTASIDATVRQWDVETYRCTQCYGLKIGPLGCVAVSPDGLTAAAGSRHNGHIAVWDLD